MAKNGNKKSSDIECDIEEIYGYLDDDIMYCRVSWNGREAKDEVRRFKDVDGELRLGKGIALTDEQIKKLHRLVEQKPKPVNFDRVFDESKGIMAARSAGFKTTDGFIELRRRNGFTL